MTNIKLVIAYDGKLYMGWQSTKAANSIEEQITQPLQKILQKSIKLNAASRTDAGVHAKGQVANFNIEKENLDLGQLVYSLNRLLPNDISVLSAQVMPEPFHATLDCKGKEYHYIVNTSPILLPQERHYVWHYSYPLNILKMRMAANLLIGTHDFRALCNKKKNEEYNDYVRYLERIEIDGFPNGAVVFKITGTHFLYKMARNIVGLLTYVGRGLISVVEVEEILKKQDRKHSGLTAPAQGLTLHRVFYSNIP